jgi:hypothetical protein
MEWLEPHPTRILIPWALLDPSPAGIPTLWGQTTAWHEAAASPCLLGSPTLRWSWAPTL